MLGVEHRFEAFARRPPVQPPQPGGVKHRIPQPHVAMGPAVRRGPAVPDPPLGGVELGFQLGAGFQQRQAAPLRQVHGQLQRGEPSLPRRENRIEIRVQEFGAEELPHSEQRPAASARHTHHAVQPEHPARPVDQQMVRIRQRAAGDPRTGFQHEPVARRHAAQRRLGVDHHRAPLLRQLHLKGGAARHGAQHQSVPVIRCAVKCGKGQQLPAAPHIQNRKIIHRATLLRLSFRYILWKQKTFKTRDFSQNISDILSMIYRIMKARPE